MNSDDIFLDVVSGDFADVIRNLPVRTVYKGNDLILSPAYLPSGAFKSWIDADVRLAAGWLKEFYFYTFNFTVGSMEDFPEASNIRLQIWSQLQHDPQISIKSELLWEYRVTNLNVESTTGILWKVKKKQLLTYVRALQTNSLFKVIKTIFMSPEFVINVLHLKKVQIPFFFSSVFMSLGLIEIVRQYLIRVAIKALPL